MNPADSEPKLPTVKTRGADCVLVDVVRQTPVEIALSRQRRKLFLILLVIIALVIAVKVIRRFTIDKPVTYQADEKHFFYGSIGSEPGGSLLHPVGGMLPPYPIFAVLPDMFPDKLPGGYASLGLIFEKDADGKQRALPIGVSRRQRLGLDMVGLNCAVCHTGTLRTDTNGPRRHIAGMPAHQLDLQRFFSFVLDTVLDPRFTPDNVIGHIEARFGKMNPVDRGLLSVAIVPQLRERTLLLKSRVGPLFSPEAPRWGPGRVDTFNPYKSLQFAWSLEALPKLEIVAASDFPALWNQAPREGMNLHWDGNNSSLDERNLSAGLGAGITPVTADFGAIGRVKNYIKPLPAPLWPEELPLGLEKAAWGKSVYKEHCFRCHDFHGADIGKVDPIEKIGTDPARLNSYTLAFSDNQNTLFLDTTNRFSHFKKTGGYANQPLDGIWARAPYLHNGSVPTLADLLEPEDKRPSEFYRGCDLYDPKKVGFVSNLKEENGRSYFLFDTRIPGNSNKGHRYGTDLVATNKENLVEYLKTL